MLISLFNGLKGAINITNVFDPASIEEANRRQEEEKRSEETQNSALSGMLDVMLGEDAHTVQKEMDDSHEQEKTKESNEQDSSIKGNLIMAFRQSGAQRVDVDDDYQQDVQQAWEYNQGR